MAWASPGAMQGIINWGAFIFPEVAAFFNTLVQNLKRKSQKEIGQNLPILMAIFKTFWPLSPVRSAQFKACRMCNNLDWGGDV